MNDTAAPTLFDVPCQFDQWCMGCRRSEEEPLIQRLLHYKKNFGVFGVGVGIGIKKSRLRSSLTLGDVDNSGETNFRFFLMVFKKVLLKNSWILVRKSNTISILTCGIETSDISL
jgi:hypothetical protein